MTQSQLDLIKKMDWDYLIILDACRYDYFEKVYSEYFQGNVKKVLSPGNWTLEWLNNIFSSYYKDIIYISANPYINSKISVGKGGLGYDARKHFYKIVDVWDFGWDESLTTTPPKEVNETFFKYFGKYKNYKYIIHYMQPHAPYIGNRYSKYINKTLAKQATKARQNLDFSQFEMIRKVGNLERTIRRFSRKATDVLFTPYLEVNLYKIIDKVLPITDRLFTIKAKMKLYRLFSLFIPIALDRGQIKTILAKEGVDGVKKAYEENLRFVLKYVKELVEFIPSGKIVITADHGELLGEDGKYGHPGNFRHPKLLEVPWLEIDKGRKKIGKVVEGEEEGEEEKEYSEKDEEIIKERLRALGYLE